MDIVNDLIAGTVAGAAAVCIEHPFDTVKVLMQAGSYDGYLVCMRGLFAGEGVRGFYRGMGARLAASGLEHAVVFSSYKASIRACGGDENRPTFGQVCLGGVSCGVASWLCLTPFELVKCKMQVGGGPSPTAAAAEAAVVIQAPGIAGRVCGPAVVTPLSGDGHVYRGSWDCAKIVYGRKGVRGLYRGGVATLFREVPGTAAWCGTYDFLKMRMTPPGENPKDLPASKMMLAGGCSGVALWTVMFPADVVKTRMQVDPSYTKYSFFQALGLIYKQQGLRGLYKGWTLTAARSFPSNAVIFVCYDTCSRSLQRLEKAAGAE